jgi:hypothetical protein
VEGFTAQVEENQIEIAAQGIQITGLTNKITSQVQLQTQALAGQIQAQGEWVEQIAMGMYGG